MPDFTGPVGAPYYILFENKPSTKCVLAERGEAACAHCNHRVYI